MKYSVSNWIFGKERLEAGFERLSRLGFDAIELRGEPQLYDVQDITALKARYGIGISSICGMYPGPDGSPRDLSHPDPAVREQAISYVADCVRFAAWVGAPLVIVTPNPLNKTRPAVSYEVDWENALSAVRRAASFAESEGILLAIEPINRYETFLINSVAKALQFAQQVGSPAVRIMADTFHMNIEDPDFGAAIRQAMDWLIHVHVADSNRMAVGHGHIPFKDVVRALKEIGYERALAMEPMPPVAEPYLALTYEHSPEALDEAVGQCITWLKLYEKVV